MTPWWGDGQDIAERQRAYIARLKAAAGPDHNTLVRAVTVLKARVAELEAELKRERKKRGKK